MGGVRRTYGLRAPKTASSGGRHWCPDGAGAALGGAVTVGYVAAPVPTLAGHRLIGDDGVDDRTARFLLKQSLALKEKEKEEERRRMALESIEQMLQVAVWHESSSFTVTRKKRKKKRKRDFLGRVAALIVDNGSGMSMDGFAVLELLMLYSRRLSAGLSCQAPLLVWTRRTCSIALVVDSDSGIYKAGFAGCFFALCFFTLSTGPRCFASWPV